MKTMMASLWIAAFGTLLFLSVNSSGQTKDCAKGGAAGAFAGEIVGDVINEPGSGTVSKATGAAIGCGVNVAAGVAVNVAVAKSDRLYFERTHQAQVRKAIVDFQKNSKSWSDLKARGDYHDAIADQAAKSQADFEVWKANMIANTDAQNLKAWKDQLERNGSVIKENRWQEERRIEDGSQKLAREAAESMERLKKQQAETARANAEWERLHAEYLRRNPPPKQKKLNRVPTETNASQKQSSGVVTATASGSISVWQ